MARPTKEEIERKEELKKFYKRDQKIYTVFEKYTDSLDNYTTLQVFCTICAVRRERFLSSEDDILLNDIDIYKLHNEYRVVDYPIYLIRGLSALLLDDNLDNEGHKKVKRALKLLLKNVPFKTIYGHKGNTEFLLKSEKYNLEIRIECKWQQSKGSVDEKFPYLYLNCIEVMPEKEIIIIVDGGGYKEGALEWLKNSVKEHKYQKDTTKKIEVMNLSDFIIWVNKTFI